MTKRKVALITGATGQDVKVVAPPVEVVVGKDTFGRSVTGGLGTADVGGAWTASAGAARQSVTAGVAALRLDAANQNTGSYLGGVSLTDATVQTSFSLDAMPTGGGTMVFVSGRRVASNQEYRVRVRFAPDGQVGLSVSRLSGGTEGFPGGEVIVPGLTYTAGTQMNVRVQVSGSGTTQVTASVWVAGTAEPTTPMLVRTDATAELQVPGAAGINVHRPASATATNVVRFTGFTVTTMTAAPVGPPPAANVAPTAAFTASPAGLAVSLDAAGSADSDGTVASYAWNFGDGATGEGETASHTYGFSGTYPVTLTVTDDHGATATTTTDVTVLAPPVLEVVASDTFNRTVTGGLGTADTGGDWTVVAGGTRQSVTPGVAELRLDAAGNNTGSYLAGVSRTDADVRTTFSLTELPTGNGTYVYVTGRRVGTGQEYRARVRVLADGRIALAVSRLAGGTEAFPGGEIVLPGLTYAAGTAVNVRVKVSGTGTTQVEATVWLAGFAEPATPSITRTDTTAELQVAGGVGLAAHRPSGTTAATAVRFAAFTVTPAV